MVFPSLNKQVVLVIGTKQGIGAAVVETFLKEEAIVIAADIGYVAQKLTQLSPNHYQIHLNIAKESQLIGLVNQLEEQQLIPDVFVAVAGISTMAFLMVMSSRSPPQSLMVSLYTMFSSFPNCNGAFSS